MKKSKKKIQKLNHYLREARQYADGLGKGMDKGIIRTVALFNALGYKTIASCEGHMNPNHGDVVPWVHIEIHRNKKRDRNIRRLVRSYWQYRMRANIPDLHAIWMHPLNEKKDKTYEVMRVTIGPGVFNSVKTEKKKIPPTVLRWFLKNGRKEMKAFTKYLELLYFGNVSLLKNPQKGTTAVE